jgi:hypothetical protein
MVILPANIRILFTNYDIITYFLNLASCSEHFISIKHQILATFDINKKNQSERLYAFKQMLKFKGILYMNWRKQKIKEFTIKKNIYSMLLFTHLRNYARVYSNDFTHICSPSRELMVSVLILIVVDRWYLLLLC